MICVHLKVCPKCTEEGSRLICVTKKGCARLLKQGKSEDTVYFLEKTFLKKCFSFTNLAEYVTEFMLQGIVQYYTNVKLKRLKIAAPLAIASSSFAIGPQKKRKPIDTLAIFQRICVLSDGRGKFWNLRARNHDGLLIGGDKRK